MYYRTFLKYATNTAAILIILIGIVFFWLPIPLGLLTMGIGVAILLTSSTKATEMLKTKRTRYVRFNSLLKSMQARMPAAIGNVLSKSEPNVTV